uniref:ATP synthase F0 subunit 8 n=1 Tax=Macroscelides flavicaudatus TaxID=432356 RepID=UPI002435E8F9|nr:ATP synthase F0 subunit 8 [Macroscelides flavicaudatus]WEW63437.1 ATP synthase F0 subunit 8 [Macroscelides flavicaudatus]
MPQLDTAPWFTVIVSMIVTLFILFQINMSKFITPLDPANKPFKLVTKTTPWDTKWTKIYLPHSLHQH